MEKLKIETKYGLGVDEKKITGFSEAELSALRLLYINNQREQLIENLVKILDERNGNIGTCWQRGYGIYGVWVGESAVAVEIGNTCD